MRLGLLDLRRSKLRFGLLGGALALLVFLLLFFNTLSATLVGFQSGAVRHTSADVLVYDSGSRRNLQASRLPAGALERVRTVPGVAAAGPIGNTTVTADVGRGLTDLSVFGWQPGLPGGPSRVEGGVVPRPGEALVDKADKGNGFTVGSVITLKPSERRLKIVGYTTESRFNVMATVYTPIETFRDIMRAANPRAAATPDNLVAVDVRRGTSIAAVTAAIGRAQPDLEALTRSRAAASIPGAAAIRQSFDLIIGITFVIVAVLTGFFFLIVTVQKARVLTSLRALGATSGYLAASLLTQVVLTVAVGVALATALLGVAALTSTPSFPIRVDPGLVTKATAAVLASSLVASLWSVRRIARLDPARAADVR